VSDSVWQREVTLEDILKIFSLLKKGLLSLARYVIDPIRSLLSKLGYKLAIYVFLVPSLGFITLFYLIPFILTFLIGMTAMDFTFKWEWVGLANYIRILNDTFAPKIMGNTLFYVFTTLTLFNVGMALVVSLITNHIPDHVGSAVRGIWLLPRITPSTVYALLWLWAARGEEPEDYYRAAKVDGASTWDIIRYVELPMIKWPLLFVTAYQTLSLLTSFEYILILTDGGPGLYTTEVWSLYSYHVLRWLDICGDRTSSGSRHNTLLLPRPDKLGGGYGRNIPDRADA